MDSNDMGKGQGSQIWLPVIFTFVILAALFIFVFTTGREQPPAEGQAVTEAGGEAVPEVTMEMFMEALGRLAPQIDYLEMDCPIDQTVLSVPNVASRPGFNSFGGVATDLMQITLGPPAEGGGRPSVDQQAWEALLVTNPNNGATYHGRDLFHFKRPGSGYAIHPDDWALPAIAPPLAKRDQAEWTVEERILMRLLTQRAYGVDKVELGFAAIQGAYAANFGTWYGKEVHIPSAAFYALAAACLREGIDEDPTMNETALSIASMTMGECYRLLGRWDDAAAAFEVIHGTSFATSEKGDIQAAMEVLTQVEALNAGHDPALEMAAHEGLQEPPVGWYLLEMLPAINGHIAEHRDEWTGLDDPDEIIEKIFEVIP